MPTPAMTHAVAVVLLLMLAIFAAYVLRVDLFLPRGLLRIAMFAVGAASLARGFSWHPYVGLFKTVRTTDFVRMDTLIYSPLCIAAGFGFLLLAWRD